MTTYILTRSPDDPYVDPEESTIEQTPSANEVPDIQKGHDYVAYRERYPKDDPVTDWDWDKGGRRSILTVLDLGPFEGRLQVVGGREDVSSLVKYTLRVSGVFLGPEEEEDQPTEPISPTASQETQDFVLVSSDVMTDTLISDSGPEKDSEPEFDKSAIESFLRELRASPSTFEFRTRFDDWGAEHNEDRFPLSKRVTLFDSRERLLGCQGSFHDNFGSFTAKHGDKEVGKDASVLLMVDLDVIDPQNALRSLEAA